MRSVMQRPVVGLEAVLGGYILVTPLTKCHNVLHFRQPLPPNLHVHLCSVFIPVWEFMSVVFLSRHPGSGSAASCPWWVPPTLWASGCWQLCILPLGPPHPAWGLCSYLGCARLCLPLSAGVHTHCLLLILMLISEPLVTLCTQLPPEYFQIQSWHLCEVTLHSLFPRAVPASISMPISISHFWLPGFQTLCFPYSQISSPFSCFPVLFSLDAYLHLHHFLHACLWIFVLFSNFITLLKCASFSLLLTVKFCFPPLPSD